MQGFDDVSFLLAMIRYERQSLNRRCRSFVRPPLFIFLIHALAQGSKTMNAKVTARNIVEALPSRVSMDAVIHALYVASKFDRGEREIRAGKGISDEDARKRLKKWQR
jgi:hypothetical protein